MPITDPTDITNCELWLAADNIVGLSDGDPVSTWNDESGNGNDATGSGTARPTYKTGIVPTSGKAVLRFDGSDDTMALPNVFTGFTSGELFLFVKTDSDPPGLAAQSGGPMRLGTAGFADHYPYTDGSIYDGQMSNSRKSTGNPSQNLAAWHRLNIISASGEYTLNLEGSTHYTTATNTVGWTTLPHVGHTVNWYRFDGDIAEIILYSRKLSSTERTDVLDYLDTKYNTAGGGGGGANVPLASIEAAPFDFASTIKRAALPYA